MTQIVLRRLAGLVPILLIVSVVVTGLVHLVPGDPAVYLAGETASPERIAEIRDRLGLNDPLVVQYWHWLTDAMQGDLGNSLQNQRPVAQTILARLPVTLSLTGGAVIVALLIGLPIGLLAALKRNTGWDRIANTIASISISVPNYWLGLLLLLAFAVALPWFPTLGYVSPTDDLWEWLRHLVLPSLALGALAGGEFARQLRSSLVDTLDDDYIRTARAKGLRPWGVVGKHALKNSMGPALTMLGLQISILLGGSVIVETIFGIPGIGQLAIRAVVTNDIPMIQGLVVFTTLIVVLVNAAVDVSYALLNPKVRLQ